MKFFIYSVFDPEVESFDQRLNVGPLDPKGMGEQYRRAFIKMEEKDKAFMEGKKAVYLGTFDDETGKIEQSQILEVFSFKRPKEEENQVIGEEEEAPKDA